MRNTILRITQLFTKFFILLDVIMAIVLMALVVAWQIDASLFENLHVSVSGTDFTFSTSPFENDASLYEKGAAYFYFVCLKGLLTCGVVFFLLRTTLTILNSISSLETFSKENVHSFRKLAKLFLLWGFISIFSLAKSADGTEMSFTLHFQYILYALIAMVLAEIFKEGHRLLEENKLTI